MKLTKLKSAAVAALIFAADPLAADGMMVEDAYARSSTANSTSGAAFMMLKNATDQDDRLIAASSTVSKKVELHTHTEDDNGVMRMGQIEGGVPVAAGETHHFKRGGDHHRHTVSPSRPPRRQVPCRQAIAWHQCPRRFRLVLFPRSLSAGLSHRQCPLRYHAQSRATDSALLHRGCCARYSAPAPLA